MIQLFLTKDLAMHVAEHLPADDPLRLGIAEIIGLQERMGGVIDEPAELTILVRGQTRMEIYDKEEAERVYSVLTAPCALQALALEAGRGARVASAVESLAAALGIR